MKSNYNQLGQYIEMVSRTNSDLKYGIEDVRGCSNTKQMMQTRANLIGRTYEKFIVLRPQEFVFNRRTTRNGEKIGMAYNNTDREYIFTNDYVAFRVKQEYLDKLLPDYLYLFFCRDEFDRYARYKSTGSATEFFNWEDMCAVPFEIPPMDFQQLVVNAYKVLNKRIETKQKINDNLRASASIMFFNKIRYVQCSECCQETEIGRYPIEWTLSTLGDVLDTIIDRRGLTPTKLGSEWSNEGIIALSAKSVKNHELVNLDIANHVDNDLYNRWMPQKLQSQDILMTSEAPLGEFYYLADFSTYCLSQRLFAMRANKTIIEPTVLYFQLTDSIGKHQIDIRKTGTTVTGIRQSELIQVPIIVPPMNIQKEFARFCNPIMITIEKNADEIRQLFKLQEMLLSRLSR